MSNSKSKFSFPTHSNYKQETKLKVLHVMKVDYLHFTGVFVCYEHVCTFQVSSRAQYAIDVLCHLFFGLFGFSFLPNFCFVVQIVAVPISSASPAKMSPFKEHAILPKQVCYTRRCLDLSQGSNERWCILSQGRRGWGCNIFTIMLNTYTFVSSFICNDLQLDALLKMGKKCDVIIIICWLSIFFSK